MFISAMEVQIQTPFARGSLNYSAAVIRISETTTPLSIITCVLVIDTSSRICLFIVIHMILLRKVEFSMLYVMFTGVSGTLFGGVRYTPISVPDVVRVGIEGIDRLL